MSSDHLTIPRPASSLSSSRSISRASQRPVSRFSQYSVTKQARVTPWLKLLIKQVTHLDEEQSPEDFQDALAIAVKRVDQLIQSSPADTSQVDAQIHGRVEKARINVQNILADTLQKTYSKLREYKDPSTSAVTTSTTISGIVEFLLHLSSAPDASTLTYAQYIPQRQELPDSQSELTWAQILSEEPFEGQHWQGAYGLPPHSTVETWDSEGSEMDLSTGESDEFEFDASFSIDESSNESSPQQISDSTSHTSLCSRDQSLRNRAVTENLNDLQYWSKGGSQYSWDLQFDFNQPWTLGPTSDKIFKDPSTLEKNTIPMKELDVIREVLFLLQGLPSILFKYDADIIKIETHWRIPHLTLSAQTSILNTFATLATVMKSLRSFELVAKSDHSPTFQAFLAGIFHQLRQFDIWCSNIETQISTKALPRTDSTIEVISLLQLQYQVEKRTSHTFHDLLGLIRAWQSRPTTSRYPSQIINMLWKCLRERQTLQDAVTAQALWEVLRTTAEPLWLNLGRWLKDGIPIDLGLEEGESKSNPTWNVEEMFIRINPLIDAAAPDFWEAKYTLKRIPAHAENAEDPVPLFLTSYANDILAAGKAVGLIRAMGLYHFLEPGWIQSWNTFEVVTNGILSLEVELHLREKLSEIFTAPCQRAQSTLSRVLIHEIHLWKHLQNIETICLTTKGDLMDQFAEQLCSKMDSPRFVWHDYHFMNAAFRSIAKTDSLLNPSLVTFSYKAARDRKSDRTVEAIEGLTVEYAVPFPLVYLFGSESSMCYSQLFCFLLQIRRAKFVLDQISLNKVNIQFSKQRPFLVTFYLIRWKLSWFINVLSTFIKMHVIDVAIRELHKSLLGATSLDEMISFHQMHLERLLHRLFLQENTSALHRAILAVLDLALRLNDCLMPHQANDTDFIRSSDLFKSSLSKRSFRPNRKKPDVIGFVESLQGHTTDGDESEEDETSPEETGFDNSEFINDESNVFEQMEYISTRMAKLIDLVRREVQSLASGVTDASETFEILAFLLEGEV